jgi:ribonuclease HI
MDLLKNDPQVSLLGEFKAEKGFQWETPGGWSTRDATKINDKGYKQKVGIYLFANESGRKIAEKRATQEKPWDKMHELLAKQAELLNIPEVGYEAFTPVTSHKPLEQNRQARLRLVAAFPNTSWKVKMRHFRNKASEAKDWLDAKEKIAHKQKRRWIAESCIYTDGGVSRPFGTAGAGVFFEFPARATSVTYEGWQNAPAAELVAIRTAIELLAQRPDKKKYHWHLFSDSLTILQGLKAYKENPLRTHGKPYTPTFHDIINILTANDIKITFHKVKSHTKQPGNDKADTLATSAYEQWDKEEGPEADLPAVQRVKKFHDPPDQIHKYYYEMNENNFEMTRTEFTQSKHIKTHAKKSTPFKARTKTVWKKHLHKTHGSLVQLEKQSLASWSPKIRKAHYQTVHKESLYQWKARKWLAKSPQGYGINDPCPICSPQAKVVKLLKNCSKIRGKSQGKSSIV